MTALADREFKRILLIKPSSPGDIIHALPVLHGLRARYPGAHIAWLVATPFVDLVAADPALSELIPFDRKRFGRLGRSWSVSVDFARFVRELAERKFDLVVDLQGLFRSGFLSLASGAGARLGFGDARECAWIFYSHRLRCGRGDVHAADKNAMLARRLGIDLCRMDFSIALTDDDRRVAEGLISEAGAAGSRFAVLVPATRWETKCWAAERFGATAAGLLLDAGMRSILVGGRDDVAAGETAARASGGAAMNACGRTTLRQLAAVIERAAIVITGDSTPMHVAAALGRPLVAIFGPTNPARTGPYGQLNDVLRLPLDCSPCYLKMLRQCPRGHACMVDMSVDRVVEAALARVNASAARTVRA